MNGASIKKPSLFGMITHPVRQFERTRDRPTIWLPLIIVLVLSSLADYLNRLNYPKLYNGERSFGSYFIHGTVNSILLFVIITLILWMIAKLGRGKTNFTCMFSLFIHVYFLTAMKDLIVALIKYFSNTSPDVFSYISLTGFVPANNYLTGFLGIFDIFLIWTLILLAIGLQKTAEASKTSSWVGIAVLFLILLGFLFIILAIAFLVVQLLMAILDIFESINSLFKPFYTL
ncbi:YIP1 family protein [Bacillus sp. CLL-7-23]|uniref:YIP1 family protein n=1 Tax=Bacillus changyiensis TaxID=3004103 RepID=A0ABT4X4I2_9BACI|nr:YIP1 family protein [Bacillus changyiensis]MDA7026287.1 YIP1 family protein [Bacillus changyiensis]